MSLRSNEQTKVVAVTGASGYVGSCLLGELEEHKELDRVPWGRRRPFLWAC